MHYYRRSVGLMEREDSCGRSSPSWWWWWCCFPKTVVAGLSLSTSMARGLSSFSVTTTFTFTSLLRRSLKRWWWCCRDCDSARVGGVPSYYRHFHSRPRCRTLVVSPTIHRRRSTQILCYLVSYDRTPELLSGDTNNCLCSEISRRMKSDGNICSQLY